MIKASEAVLKEAMHLHRGELYRFLVEWRLDTLERLAHATKDHFEAIKGEAKTLKALMDLIETARPTLEQRAGKVDSNKMF